jgi:hypothetical protein
MGLSASSEAALECLGVGSTDEVVVVFNGPRRAIAEALVEAAKLRAGSVAALEFPMVSRDGEEPPADVAEIMGRADVVLAPTSRSLSQTEARRHASAHGARSRPRRRTTTDVTTRAIAAALAAWEWEGRAHARRLARMGRQGWAARLAVAEVSAACARELRDPVRSLVLLPFEYLSQMQQCGPVSRLHGPQRHAQLGSDLALRHPLQVGQFDDLALPGWQPLDAYVQVKGFELGGCLVVRRR